MVFRQEAFSLSEKETYPEVLITGVTYSDFTLNRLTCSKHIPGLDTEAT